MRPKTQQGGEEESPRSGWGRLRAAEKTRIRNALPSLPRTTWDGESMRSDDFPGDGRDQYRLKAAGTCLGFQRAAGSFTLWTSEAEMGWGHLKTQGGTEFKVTPPPHAPEFNPLSATFEAHNCKRAHGATRPEKDDVTIIFWHNKERQTVPSILKTERQKGGGKEEWSVTLAIRQCV